MSEKSLKIIGWCVLVTALGSIFLPIFYMTIKEMGLKQGAAIVLAYLAILSVMILPSFFPKDRPWEIPPQFKYQDRVINKIGRTGTVVDYAYQTGEMASIKSYVYRVKWDDGEFENVIERWDSIKLSSDTQK